MNFLTSLRTLLLALVLSIGISYAYAAWSPPTQTPPLGNIDAPVNIGGGSQTKTGPLWVNGIFSSAGGYITGNLEVVGNVGIGVASPTAKLDVAGAIKVGDTSTCTAGAIRFRSNDFEGCTDGTTWKSLTASSGGGGTPPPIPTVNLNYSDGDGKIPVEYSIGLSWTSTDATGCAVETSSSAGWSGGKPLSGSETITPPSAGNKTYTLTCTNSSGSASDSVVIDVRPWATVSGQGGFGESCNSWLAGSGQAGVDGSSPRTYISSNGSISPNACVYSNQNESPFTQCTGYTADTTGGVRPVGVCGFYDEFLTQTRR